MRSTYRCMSRLPLCCTVLLCLGLLAWSSIGGTKEDLLSLSGGKRMIGVWSSGSKISGFDTDRGLRDPIYDVGSGYAGRPFVTADGERIVFSTGFNSTGIGDFSRVHKVHIVNWDGSGHRILANNGYLCQIWTDGNGHDWAIWMNSNRKDHYKMNLTTNGNPVKFFTTSGGRADLQLTTDGRHACWSTGSGHTGLIEMPSGNEICRRGGCRSSIAPDNSLRWSHFQSTAHTAIEVRKNCNKVADIGLNGGSYFPRWTGHPRIFAWSNGSTHGPGPRVMLGKFNNGYTGWEKTVVLHSGSNLAHPWARVINAPAPPPTVAISAFEATPPTIKQGESSTLSWTTTNATSVTLDGQSVAKSGTKQVTPSQTTQYTLEADGEGGPAVKKVTVTVSEPALTSIEITPSTGSVAIGGSVTYSAQPLDQFGDPIAGSVQWSVSGNGSIAQQSGSSTVFTASDAAGTAVLTASSGSVEHNLTIRVLDPSAITLMVNCGGSTEENWASDAEYAAGGDGYDFNCGPDVSSVTISDPPAGSIPQSVLQTVRHNPHSYSFAGLPDGCYRVVIYWMDCGVPENRGMDYSIEGEQILTDYSPAIDAGGTGKVAAKEFRVDVTDGNGLQVQPSKGSGNDVFESAIYIAATDACDMTSGDEPALSSPAAGERFLVQTRGQKYTIAVPRNSTHRLDIVNAAGMTIKTFCGSGAARYVWAPGKSCGMYVVRMQADDIVRLRRLMVLR